MISEHDEHDSAPRGDRLTDAEVFNPPAHDRRGYLGATDSSAIVGLSQFSTIWDVYAEKVGLSDPKPPTPAMEWGSLFEDVIASVYAKRNGVELAKAGYVHDPEHIFCGGHPDRLIVGRREGIEIKVVGPWARDGWGEPGTDAVPLDYLCQAQKYLMLTKYDRWFLSPFFWGKDLLVYPVEPDAELQQMLRQADVDFWNNHVLPQIPPPVDGSNGCAMYLRNKYRGATGGPVIASTPLFDDIAAKLRESKRKLKAIKTEKQSLENQIKAALGEAQADGIEGGWGRVTWKPNKKGQRTLRPKFTGENEDDNDD